MNEQDWLFLEDPDVYDGWIARRNWETGEIILRDFYKTENWTDKQKREYIWKLRGWFEDEEQKHDNLENTKTSN